MTEPTAVEFRGVGFRYGGDPVFEDVSFRLPEGEFCLLTGPTGSGKTTLLRMVDGLVPYFSGGTVTGSVTVGGREIRTTTPAENADLVGYVNQDPLAGFVTDDVVDELAFTAEQLAVPSAAIRKRLTEIMDLVGLAELRGRTLATLSAGQRQRVAIGAALTAGPRILVLDEPTSALDPAGADEVLSILHRLVHDLGITVLLSEHRLERVIQYADSGLVIRGTSVVAGALSDTLAGTDIAPPVVKLAEAADLRKADGGLPVTVRDTRRVAEALRDRLDGTEPPHPRAEDAPILAEVDGLCVDYKDFRAVDEVSLAVRRGQSTALTGRNGSGKSSLLWAVQGTGPRSGGRVSFDGTDPADLKPPARRALVGLVPSEPADLLYHESVAAECAEADGDSDAPAGTCEKIFHKMVTAEPGAVPPPADASPRDLSEGQKLALALAVTLTAAPPLLLLDEPTRGLDYGAKGVLTALLHEHTAAGGAVLLASHDVEFIAEFADHVHLLSDGQTVAEGPARDMMGASPMFAPQVAKVLPGWMTVGEVEAALDE
ncbi:ABC transporter ATP-binding protein [Salininema proteolyticum]|uniref:ABC transporter ATP-binding protein n=1 Tax=Salininema proteolyticum TaxID=1607685 RepID=A0ABV8TTX6_9ACTN